MTRVLKKIIVFLIILSLSFCFVSPINSTTITNYSIMNDPTSSKQQIIQWAKNRNCNELFISWIDMAYDIAEDYGVDPTVLIAQTAIETGFGEFGGVIDSSYHNTAGIKTTNGVSNYIPNAHMKFDTWRQSFIAQAQHLRLYAGKCYHMDYDDPEIVDPRHFPELNNRATTVNDLSGVWATNVSYGSQINKLCNEIVETKVTSVNKVKEPSYTKEQEDSSYAGYIKNKILNDNENNKLTYLKELLLNKKNGKGNYKTLIIDNIKKRRSDL